MFKTFQEKKWLFLIMAIILYIIFAFSCLIFKYNNFKYNGMDLAIFNQVFYHSSQGNLFHFTIHPHSYLGDHFAPFLLLLLPLYSISPSPLTLLLLQTIIIASCAIPIYLLTKHNINKKWALILSLLWLINPLAINMNFFEFHLLPFAMFFLLFTVYFYQKKNWKLFILFSLLSLSVREDVFLVILMFSILALIQKRKLKWILNPIILASTWFSISQIIIGPHNPLDTYKFIPYYNWLGGNSMLEIAINYLTHPWTVIKHLFMPNNIIMLISLLIPFIFIPALKPKYLILSFLIYLQFALTKNGGGDIILKTHYAALFIPGIIASFILSVKFIIQNKSIKWIKILQDNQNIIVLILIITNLYLLLTLTPFQIKNEEINNEKQENLIKRELLKTIPKNNSIVTSYEFLPYFSTQPELYSLNYAWRGYKQLSYEPYELPDINYIYVNFEDVIRYDLQYTQDDPDQKYEKSYLNWQKIFENRNLYPEKIIDTYGIWSINSPNQETKLYDIINTINDIQNPQNININNEITFLGWDWNKVKKTNEIDNVNLKLLPITLYFQKNSNYEIENNYQLELNIQNYHKLYPLTYGFHPTSKWVKGEIIKINYWFLVPPEFKNVNEYIFNLVELKGNLTLDKNLSFMIDYKNLKKLKPDIIIK